MSTAEQIKKIRLKLCLNQAEFASALCISNSCISYYESGAREPSFSTIRKILALAKKNNIKVTLEDIRSE